MLSTLATTTLLSKASATAGDRRGYSLNAKSTGEVGIILRNINSTNDIVLYSNTKIVAGAWTHLIVTYNGNSDVSGINMYFDSVKSTTSTVRNGLSATILTSASCTFFADQIGTTPFNGIADDVAIYATVLTSAQASSHYIAATT